jgi:hypothetical protein
MPQPHNSPVRVQFGLRGWAAIVTAVIVLGAVTVLAFGFLVFMLPVLILAPVIYWLVPKPKVYRVNNPAEKEVAGGTTIIDGDFRVISGGASEGKSEPSNNLKP